MVGFDEEGCRGIGRVTWSRITPALWVVLISWFFGVMVGILGPGWVASPGPRFRWFARFRPVTLVIFLLLFLLLLLLCLLPFTQNFI